MDSNEVELATELTIAWLSNANTRVSPEDVPAFLATMHGALKTLGATVEEATPTQEFTAAVTARKSLASPDFIISMIDGKAYKTLRRHLSGHGMTPDQYRERFGLKRDYPMVAESYSASRRAMAKKIGLGRKKVEMTDAQTAAKKAPAKGGRIKKTITESIQSAKEHLGG